MPNDLYHGSLELAILRVAPRLHPTAS